MVKIGSCTVIYNPNEEVISNIERYCNHVDVAVVVDNSDKKNGNYSVTPTRAH